MLNQLFGPQYLWDVITCPCPWYLILAQHSWITGRCPSCQSDVVSASVNSLWPSDAYMRQYSIPTLVQIMPCRLFGAKPLSEQMLPCWQLVPPEHSSVKLYSNCKSFLWRKCTWKCRLRNDGHFVSMWKHWNIFRVTGPCARNSPVTGEFPAQRPVTRSFDVFFDLRLKKRLSKQSWGWWFEKPSCSLWRHCNLGSSFLRQKRNHVEAIITYDSDTSDPKSHAKECTAEKPCVTMNCPYQ